MDLTILSLTTLGSIKNDALDMLRNPETSTQVRIEAVEVVTLVDRELDRRIDWARAARMMVVDEPDTRPVHTVRGKAIGPEGSAYGVTHDYDCPGCEGTSFTSSPRSETYWSS